MKGRGVYIKTFGCQMNEHDTERMLGILSIRGFVEVEEPKKADIIIFNTCAIREKAEQKFLSSLGRLKHIKNKKPNLKIIVAGCSAQIQGINLLKNMPFIDYVIGPDNIDKLESIIESKYEKPKLFLSENPDIAIKELPALRRDSVKAWINIIYGCNNYCAYCVVPYTRGRERSRPAESIINEVKFLAQQGYKEITLLGQNVNSYRDGDIDFPLLLEKLNNIEGIERIRFVTSHPKDLSKKLVNTMKDCEKVCEHIHLPLQAGSNKILKLMNRKYTYEEYIDKIFWLREAIPNISITSDIIVGFPQELDEDFEKTILALKEIQFDGIFAFKFSARPGTVASKLEGKIPESVKSKRLTEVLNLQNEITERKNKIYENAIHDVLIEDKNEEGVTIGRTRTNKIVKIKRDLLKGQTVKVKIVKSNRHSLEGELIQ
jgi:tRNA-2-methylthio-N6-dimethylallyladenosine synthase